jgi:formamidopyrimidine-DNA glycosylase
MPELPEVETVRRTLEKHVVGQRITSLQVTDFPGVLGGWAVEDARQRIEGRTITGIRRRGKYLFIDLDDGTSINAHLRMTGRFSVVDAAKPPLRHERLALGLENGLELRFSDQRKFGHVVPMHQAELDLLEERLGPEPLGELFTIDYLRDRLRRRPGKIKAVLLDQRLVAGLGNIYVDEALFLSNIHPMRVARSLDEGEIANLHAQIQRVLVAAIARKGTTFSSFEDAEGQPGDYAVALQVYGGGNKRSCPNCGTPLERTVIGGRGTSFCPSCQPSTPAGVSVQ